MNIFQLRKNDTDQNVLKKLKYHQTTALYSEKLIRIKRSINEQTILKLKKKP